MKHLIKKALILVTMMIGIFTMTSCQNNKQVSLTLYPNNGNPSVTVNVNKNESLDKLISFSYDGYFFVGWYYDREFKNRVVFPTTFEEDTALYGGWHTYVNYELDETTDTYAVTSVVLPFNKIEVLREYKGKEVTIIRENAFKDNENIVQLVLPNTITTIEDNAFSNMTKLEEINLPDSITNIGKNLFVGSDNIIYDNHSGLKYIDNWLVDASECSQIEVKLKDTTIGIFEEAFKNCIEITKITIPAHLWYLGQNAFVSTNSLKEIEVSENNSNFSSLNGVLYNKDQTILIKYPSSRVNVEITIPFSVKVIEERAFDRCHNLVVINLTTNLEEIKKHAFYNCRELTTINYLTNNVKIDDEAFVDCPKLK